MQTNKIGEANRRKRLSFVDIFTVVFLGYMIAGDTSANQLYIGLGLFILWVLVAAFANPAGIKKALVDNIFLCLLFYLFYSFVMGLFNGEVFFLFKQFVAGLIIYSPILIYSYYSTPSRKTHKTAVCALVIAVWIFYMIKSCVFYFQNEGAARILASDITALGDVRLGGGYALAYGSALLGCFCVLCAGVLRKMKIKLFWVFPIIILISAVLIFNVQSTVTLIAFTIGMITSILFGNLSTLSQKKQTSTKAAIALLTTVLICIILIPSFNYIGKWLIEYSSSIQGSFGNRLLSLGYILTGDMESGAYGIDRAAIVLKSLNTFFENPIIGVCYKHGNGFLGMSSFGLGNHCEWTDALANLGIIGGIPFLMIYIKQVRKIFRIHSISFLGCFICLLLMGTFNPLRSFQPNLILFFVIPALTDWMIKRNQQMIEGQPA